MDNPDRTNIIGVQISVIDMEGILEFLKSHWTEAKGRYICFANAHTCVLARMTPSYRNIQNNSFLTLPDGKPLSMIGKMRELKNMGRVTGPEFMEYILQLSIQNGWKHYFYGNTKENLFFLINYTEKCYPGLNICGFKPSMFRELSNEEKAHLVEEINQSHADFVWVGIGAPRQEILCAELCGYTKAVWIGVGGAFNVICGIIPRAPEWMQKCCLEWFYRWIKEPRRLFKRYLLTNTKFIAYLIKDKIRTNNTLNYLFFRKKEPHVK